MSKTTDLPGKLDSTSIVLNHFGLVDQRDQFEMFLTIMNVVAPALEEELALAVICVLMLKSGVKSSAVVKTIKASRETFDPGSIFIFNGEYLLVQTESGEQYVCFRLSSMEPVDVASLKDGDLCTTMIFHVTQTVEKVRNLIKE